jgi:uncharacterized membrane protein YgcG
MGKEVVDEAQGGFFRYVLWAQPSVQAASARQSVNQAQSRRPVVREHHCLCAELVRNAVAHGGVRRPKGSMQPGSALQGWRLRPPGSWWAHPQDLGREATELQHARLVLVQCLSKLGKTPAMVEAGFVYANAHLSRCRTRQAARCMNRSGSARSAGTKRSGSSSGSGEMSGGGKSHRSQASRLKRGNHERLLFP